MKKRISMVVLLVILVLAGGSCENRSTTKGEELYAQAVMLDNRDAYISAKDLYQQARAVLVTEGNAALADRCRLSANRLEKILIDYSATEAKVRAGLKDKFPDLPESKIAWLLSRIDHLDIEGARYYYSGFLNTAVHLDLSLMARLPAAIQAYKKFWDGLAPYVFGPPQVSGSPFRNPVQYVGNLNADVPRAKLPGTGTLKIWQPLPISTDCQTDAGVVSVDPAQYVKHPPTMDGDLGDIYFEVPLEQLAGDLRLSLQFRFTHYEQRFTMIDPDNVGQYDKKSELYKKYTASEKNIRITPGIREKALELAAGEQNPYLLARRIYEYVVNDITYSTMPHLALESLGVPESVYVHQHRFRDCGAQSIYFSALCRALGIPARASGGWQLIPGVGGDHFWAEFYLENYGWVPVDTSVGQLGLYPLGQTPDQAQVYINYFFASMDPYRWVIQRNVDVPFVPASPEPPFLALALQEPAMVLESMEGIPELALGEYFKVTVAPAP